MNCENCGCDLGGGAIALRCRECSNLNRAHSTASEPAQPRQYGPYPHACAVLARESERLLHSMRITLETPTEAMVRAANERHVAAELDAANLALVDSEARLTALIELVAAANDDRNVWLRRCIKTAEALT